MAQTNYRKALKHHVNQLSVSTSELKRTAEMLTLFRKASSQMQKAVIDILRSK